MFEDLLNIPPGTEEEEGNGNGEENASFNQKRRQYKEAVETHTIQLLSNASDTTVETITSRFSQALDLRRLATAHIVIVGAGGIGSPVAKNLVAMGAKNLTVIDYDTVEPQNVGTQFYKATDIGLMKVEALRDELLERYMTEINPVVAKVESATDIIKAVSPAFQDAQYTHIDVLIGAVDNMEFRNTVGAELSDTARMYSMPVKEIDLYIDARMSLGLWNVFTLPLNAVRNVFNAGSSSATERNLAKDMIVEVLETRYTKDALFPPEEGMNEPCTARALGYTGENIASYIAAMVDFYFRGFYKAEPVDVKEFLDLNTLRSEKVPFKWAAGFDARGFITTDVNPFLEKKKAEVVELQQTVAGFHERLAERENKIQELTERVTVAGFHERLAERENKIQELTERVTVAGFHERLAERENKIQELTERVTLASTQPDYDEMMNAELTGVDNEDAEPHTGLDYWYGEHLAVGTIVKLRNVDQNAEVVLSSSEGVSFDIPGFADDGALIMFPRTYFVGQEEELYRDIMAIIRFAPEQPEEISEVLAVPTVEEDEDLAGPINIFEGEQLIVGSQVRIVGPSADINYVAIIEVSYQDLVAVSVRVRDTVFISTWTSQEEVAGNLLEVLLPYHRSGPYPLNYVNASKLDEGMEVFVHLQDIPRFQYHAIVTKSSDELVELVIQDSATDNVRTHDFVSFSNRRTLFSNIKSVRIPHSRETNDDI